MNTPEDRSLRSHFPGDPVSTADLVADLDADELRSGTDRMRDGLVTVTQRGHTTWTGPLDVLVAVLVDVARVDLALARLVEGHADALRILDQAGRSPGAGVYGVWASRSAGTGLRAESVDGDWHLRGELRFASGIGLIDRALVPGWVDEDHHLLFDIDAGTATADETTWRTPAMDASRSFTVDLDVDAGEPVGPTDFYLLRPGFVVGGLCVAAVWAGGLQQVVDLVTSGIRAYRPSAHQLRRIGAMEQARWQAQVAVDAAVQAVTTEQPGWEDAVAHARTAVATACDDVLDQAGKVVGPGGLSRNGRLARAVADLGIYVRQHHTDLELERAGHRALETHTLLG